MTALAVLADVRQEAPDAVHDAHQVDVDHPAPIIDRDLVDAAATCDAGIVADDMDVADGAERCLCRAIDA